MIASSISSTTIDLTFQITNVNGGAPTSSSASSGTSGTSTGDSDGDGGRVHHGGGGGHLLQALEQAFQSLGLTPASSSSSSNGAASSTSSTSSSSDSTDAATSLETALRNFVQALFTAVRDENTGTNGTPVAVTTPATTATTPATTTPATTTTTTPTTTAATTTTPATTATTPTITAPPPSAPPWQFHGQRGHFSSGLAALITQVSNGNAPTDLQNAFNTLVTDLQAAGGNGNASTSTTTTGTGTTASGTPVTLQSLLTTLQQDLGYDNNNASAAAVSSVNAHA